MFVGKWRNFWQSCQNCLLAFLVILEVTLGRHFLSTYIGVTKLSIRLEVILDVEEEDPIGGRGDESTSCSFSLCAALVT